MDELLLLFIVAYPSTKLVDVHHLTKPDEPRIFHALGFSWTEEVKPKNALKAEVAGEYGLRLIEHGLPHLINHLHPELIHHRSKADLLTLAVVPVNLVCHFTDTNKVLDHLTNFVVPAVTVLNIFPYGIVELCRFLVLKLVFVLRKGSNARSIRQDVVLVDFTDALNVVNSQPDLLLFREPLVVPNAVPEPRAFTSVMGTSHKEKVRALLCIQVIIGVFTFFIEPNQFLMV